MRIKHYFLMIGITACIAGCAEMEAKTSHYGHGAHRCYFHNSRTGQWYKGAASTQKEASSIAKTDCRAAIPEYQDKAYCVFGDCVFK